MSRSRNLSSTDMESSFSSTSSGARCFSGASVFSAIESSLMSSMASESHAGMGRRFGQKNNGTGKNIGVRNAPAHGHNGVGAPIHQARRRRARLILAENWSWNNELRESDGASARYPDRRRN